MRIYGEWAVGPQESYESAPEEMVPAQVPGGAQLDYAVHHGWGDYNYGMNARRYDGLEERYWLYRSRVSLPRERRGEPLFFVAKGIDYEFEVRINGEKVFYQEGMFTPVELDVTDRLTDGDTLEVLIYPAPKREGAKVHDREEADACCKPAVSYGWDWHPYLVALGIWDECYLEYRPRERIAACELFYTLSEDFSSARLHFETVTTVEGGRVEYILKGPGGEIAASSDRPDFELQNPLLWWCNGQGQPNLYTWQAVLQESGHRAEGRVGFRRVELRMNADDWRGINGTRPNPPMTVTLNGRRIFAKGSNWVNPEIFPGTIGRDTYEPLLRMAKENHFNLLRVWGGSIVNKESFFELCDEYGLLIWQEFPLSCNKYPDAPRYLKILEQEARSIVARVRQHPCLALWCGGNELFCGWSRMTDQSLALRLLNKICYELDPGTPFIPTSPIMGVSHGSYVFLYLDGRDVFTVSQARRNTAYTEFGIPSLPEADYLRSFIPEEELFPPKPGGTYEFHHAFNAWGGQEPWLCRHILKYYFGEPACIEDMVEQSKWLQREGYKAFFEEARRQKPFCSMAVNWCYNEPWKTAANNSLICYPAIPKDGLYAVGESCRDVMASARIPKFLWYGGETLCVEPWLLSDSPEAYPNFTLRVSVELSGKTIELGEWRTGSLPANENRHGDAFTLRLPEWPAGRLTVRVVCMENRGMDSVYHLLYRPYDAPQGDPAEVWRVPQ